MTSTRQNGQAPAARRALRLFVAALLALVSAACSSWQPFARGETWTLVAERALPDAEVQAYRAAIEPAIASATELLGPLEQRVTIHVWDGEAPAGPGQVYEGEGGPVQVVPGIGPARVRAFHARGSNWFGPDAGVYLSAPETGTIAHELVHARMAEESGSLPLWLEEGLASIVGDGYLDGARWVVDGLACWPLRELTEARIEDTELARLLALSAEDQSDVRENVLAHFVGWAIVFDLYREAGRLDWQAWIARYAAHIDLAEARQRLDRTLEAKTVESWLVRLDDPAPAVRIATAKGLWKLRSLRAVEGMLARLAKEEDPLVRIVLSLNVLACAGEMNLPDEIEDRMWRRVWPTLRRAKLEDPRESKALEQIVTGFRWGSRQSSRAALDALRAYWAE